MHPVYGIEGFNGEKIACHLIVSVMVRVLEGGWHYPE